MFYSLDLSEKITMNNSDYYLRIRTCNTQNPVVLFLHGGCGASDRPFIMKRQSPLAEYCTVVAKEYSLKTMLNYVKAKAIGIQKVTYRDVGISRKNSEYSMLKNSFNATKSVTKILLRPLSICA